MSSSLSPLQQPFELQSFSSSEPRHAPEHLNFPSIATPSTNGTSHTVAEFHLQHGHQSQVSHTLNHKVYYCVNYRIFQLLPYFGLNNAFQDRFAATQNAYTHPNPMLMQIETLQHENSRLAKEVVRLEAQLEAHK
jgi:hypothetical protein